MKKLISVLCVFLFSTILLSSEEVQIYPLDGTYRNAQREFHKKNYEKALPLLEKYLENSKNKNYKKGRLFWVIDQIGRIHLRVNRKPDAAIKFFEKLLKNKRLSEAQEDDVLAWITAAKDWKKLAKMPKNIMDENELFKLGKRFYNKGISLKKFPADSKGNAYFTIAKTYLVPLVVNYEKSPKLGEALFMLGDIQTNLRTDIDYWGDDNYYLKEAIRRFPHSELAMKAWRSLSDDIELGHTGSSGNNTPQSLKDMLLMYKKLAQKKTTDKKIKSKG